MLRFIKCGECSRTHQLYTMREFDCAPSPPSTKHAVRYGSLKIIWTSRFARNSRALAERSRRARKGDDLVCTFILEQKERTMSKALRVSCLSKTSSERVVQFIYRAQSTPCVYIDRRQRAMGMCCIAKYNEWTKQQQQHKNDDFHAHQQKQPLIAESQIKKRRE